MSFGPGSTVLVTGANGLVGSRVVARLAQARQPVIATGRGPRGEAIADLPGVEYVETDLARAGSLREAIERAGPGGIVHCGAMTDVEVVFHCAAQVRPTWDRHRYVRNNVRGTQTVLEAAFPGRSVSTKTGGHE